MGAPAINQNHAGDLFDLARRLSRLTPYHGNPECFFLDREKLAEGILAMAQSIQGAQTKTAAEAGPLDSGSKTIGKEAAFRQIACHGRSSSATEKRGGVR